MLRMVPMATPTKAPLSKRLAVGGLFIVAVAVLLEAVVAKVSPSTASVWQLRIAVAALVIFALYGAMESRR